MWLAVFLHFSLMMILGPWGMNHRVPVLIWNVFFVFQLFYLFLPEKKPSLADPQNVEVETAVAKRSSSFSLPLQMACVVIVLIPMGRLAGVCDHWLGWELYAPRSSRVQLEVIQPPPALNEFIKPGILDFSEIDLGQMSLERLDVPVYPQQRFQVGVVIGLLERYDLDSKFRVTCLSESDRWTGERQKRVITDLDKLKSYGRQFRINAMPAEQRRAD